MFITVECRANESPKYKKALLKAKALKYLRLYTMNTADYQINNYLLDTYHQNFKMICWNLIKQSKVLLSDSNKLTVVFPNQKADKLASLITYGNGKILGSTVLRDVFKV